MIRLATSRCILTNLLLLAGVTAAAEEEDVGGLSPERLETRFAELPPVEISGFRVAVRHQPLLDEAPGNLPIAAEDGAIRIAKSGGRECYHVFPEPGRGLRGPCLGHR